MATKTMAKANPKPKSKPQKPREKPRSRARPHQRLNAPELVKVLLTVEEAGEALAMCRYTVNKLIASGELQSIKIGRMRRVPTQALEAFVSSRLQAQSIA